MSGSCIFCKIVGGQIPSVREYEDENTIVIRDIHPQAKAHYLVIPKRHVDSIADAFEDDGVGREVAANLFSTANRFARKAGMWPEGFRSVINSGELGGQTVAHLHLHLLGGEKLGGSFA